MKETPAMMSDVEKIKLEGDIIRRSGRGVELLKIFPTMRFGVHVCLLIYRST